MGPTNTQKRTSSADTVTAQHAAVKHWESGQGDGNLADDDEGDLIQALGDRGCQFWEVSRDEIEAGHEGEDWLAAEREVRQRYHQQSA